VDRKRPTVRNPSAWEILDGGGEGERGSENDGSCHAVRTLELSRCSQSSPPLHLQLPGSPLCGFFLRRGVCVHMHDYLPRRRKRANQKERERDPQMGAISNYPLPLPSRKEQYTFLRRLVLSASLPVCDPPAKCVFDLAECEMRLFTDRSS